VEEHPPELDALLALIDARLEPERAPAVRDFACAYVRRLSGDAQGGPPATEALFHEIVGIFELACARDGAPAAVRAFNPSVTEDGYETPGSVVETNTEDLPFLVDSVTAELQARGLGIRRVRHPIVGTERAANGQIERIAHPRRSSTSESVMHFDLDRRLDPEELADVEDAVRVVLGEVRRVVRDFPAMRQRLAGMIEIARGGQARYDADEIEETVAFLEWLARDAFILLGYREYELADGHIRAVPTSGLGLLADVSRSAYAQPVAVASLPAELQAALAEGSQLVITKTNASSPVHKRARMDDVAVRRVAADGSTAGWARLLGLFTTKAYTQPASETPVLAAKLRAILAAEDLIEGSHDYKAAVSLFASLPKDELFAASTEDLRRAVVGLLSLEGDAVRVMGRRHGEGRSVSLLIALPHARYGVGMRERLRDLAARRFGTPSVAVHEVFGEGDRVLVHLTVHSARGDLPYVPFRELEREVVALTRTWEDAVRETLVARHGEQRGRKLAARWLPRLPEAYKAAANAETAVHDVGCLERLAVGGESFVVSLHADPGGARTRVVFATTGGKVELARIMPVLQDLGLRVIDEIPTRVGEGETWV
jgi:glutamate dehydrogenase